MNARKALAGAALLYLAREYAAGSSMPLAIDPIGCGCTECGTGEYVPLNLASDAQLRAMFAGRVADNTCMTPAEMVRYIERRVSSWYDNSGE